ncbi:MAG: protease family protein [Clostridia bacterium]|jgi:hypothetical protein|nr:protease family protein [Clostridia bacterium]
MSRIKDIYVLFTIILAAIFWYLTFAAQIINFWLSMTIAASTLSILAIYWGGFPFSKSDINLRSIIIGISSAIILYFVFWAGNILSQIIFDFARPQIISIYDIRTQGQAILINLILLFITSPGEEIFWRNFLQKWSMNRFGDFGGWVLASLIYAGVHISSRNFMLVMAALVAGLFWGFIYWRENNVVPVIISHQIWTIGIFVIFPVM